MSWNDFQRQYHATGREKGDGYSPRDFDGMSEEERAHARTMMLDRALAGDSVDLSGLRYIGGADVVAALDGLVAPVDWKGRLDWRSDIIRHEVLFELTGQHRYLTDLTRYLDGRDPDAQERAARAFTWYVLPSDAEPFLLDRIAVGRHESAILPLLEAWIGLHERAVCDIMCFQRHIELTRTVSNAKPVRRRVLLADAAATLSSV